MRLYSLVNALTVCPKNSWPGFYSNSLCDYYHKIKLLDAISEVQTWNDYLLITRGSSLSQIHYDLLTLPSIVMVSQIDTGDGGLLVTNNTYSLWNAVKQFVTSAKAISKLHLDEINTSEQNTFFVVVNGDIEGFLVFFISNLIIIQVIFLLA